MDIKSITKRKVRDGQTRHNKRPHKIMAKKSTDAERKLGQIFQKKI